MDIKNNFPTTKLIYTPHRLYHRYARARDMNDQIESKKMFINALKSNDNDNNNKNIDRIYLSRIESGLSHAFCAIKDKNNNKWILLDSIIKKYGYIKDEQEMINEPLFCGKASCMILRDYSRDCINLDQYKCK